MKVFLLYEVVTYGFGRNESTLIEIFTDWKKCEDARVGMMAQRDNGFVTFEIVDMDVRE